MKTIVLGMIFTLFLGSLSAQSTIAKLKYEQAEEAFGKNDFYTASAKLEEVEKLLGAVNPKILYLRIMAQHKLVYEDSTVLESLKKNVATYLKKYDGQANLEDKYKEVFLVSEHLVQLAPNVDFTAAKQLLDEKNYEAALPLLRKAAGTGYGRALNSLGVLYENGFGVGKDNTEALKWYTRAAEKGNGTALYHVGRFYYHGIVVGQNSTEALNYFQQAVEKNSLLGLVGLADTHYHLLKDYVKAAPIFQQAAGKGNVYAMRMTGQVFYFGSGVTKDYATALSWFQKAADLGDGQAMNFLGVMNQNGFGMPVNYAAAHSWFLKATEKNIYYAFGNLGLLYDGGLGVKKNKKIAKEWREKQAAPGLIK